MKLRRLTALLTLFFLAASSANVANGTSRSWHLVWSDEFNGPAHTAPRVADWAYDTGAGLWGTGEIENYCAAFSSVAPCNAAQPNTYLDGHGNLVIQAIENHGAWTSGRLLTKGRHAFQYGRIEARMKLPAGAGFWPAFWMLGSNIDTVQWPQCGEIDIMEWVQSYTRVATSSTVHGPGYSGPEGITSKFTFSHHETVDDSFHTYGVIWTKDKLQFYRDSPEHPYLTVTPAQLPPGAKWVYNQPFFLLLNFAIGGGGFAGNTDSTTPQTGTVLVDYVRVYQELAH